MGTYRIAKISGRNPAGGASASLSADLSAFIKDNSTSSYCVSNEYICTSLGRFLALPLPPGAIVVDPTNPTNFYFASLDFNLRGSALPPVVPADCFVALPQESSGVVLFDILVGNSDRHSSNLSLDRSVTPNQLDIFDHSHALFGALKGDGIKRLNSLKKRLGITGGPHTGGNRHCLLDVIDTDNFIKTWIDRIQEIPDYLVQHLCRQCTKYGISSTEADIAVEFLTYRRDNIKKLIEDNKAEFKSIAQWSLI